MFKLIQSPAKPQRPSKQELFRKAFERKLSSISGKSTVTDDMSLVLLGVKALSIRNDDIKDLEYLLATFELMSCIKEYMSHLTPRQFMNTFPITKTYDGDKYECKDYFYTKSKVDELDKDIPIGEDKIDDFLWDYMNRDTQNFTVAMLSLMSDIMRAKGEPGIMERFSAEFGVPFYHMDEGKKQMTGPIQVKKDGDEYYLDDSEAETVAVRKPRPKYLKVVTSSKN